MANDNFDDVDHLMKALSLDGVRYRDFSGRAHPPKLKLIGGRRETQPAEPSAPPASAAAPAEGQRNAPVMPPPAIPPTAPPAATTAPITPAVPVVTSAEPVALPDESLQATFSRLIARAPAPQPRKLKLELQLPPRQPAAPPAAAIAREQPTLGSLFDRLSGRPGLTTPKKTG